MARAGALLWGLAPVIAAWRERDLHPTDEPPPPFKRRRHWDWPVPVVGLAAIAAGWRFDIGWLTLIGAGYLAFGAVRVAARATLPRRWFLSEMDFLTFTSVDTLTRIAMLSGLVVSLILGRWYLAAFFGFVLTGLVLLGLLMSTIAHRKLARRETSA